MPQDNLTDKFLRELREKHNITWSRQKAQDFIKSQSSAPAIGSTTLPPTPEPGGVGDMSYLSSRGMIPSAPRLPDTDRGLLGGLGHGLTEFAGQAAWHGADVASFGLLGYWNVDEMLGIKPFEELGSAGKVGAVLGEAAGFLVPLKGIGTLVGRGVSSIAKKGTHNVIKRATERAAAQSIKPAAVERAVQKTLKDKDIKKLVLPRMAQNAEAQKLAHKTFGETFFNTMKKEVPDMADDDIASLTATLLSEMDKGLYVNSIGKWIMAARGGAIDSKTLRNVTRYGAHVAEMTTSFGLYNLLEDGIRSSYTDDKFSPGKDLWHALTFSAFLPAVEMIGGGGKIPIRKTAMHARKLLNKVKSTDYSGMSEKQLQGLLKSIVGNSYLQETEAGVIAGRAAWKHFESSDVAKSELIRHLKMIRGLPEIERFWSMFRKEAGKDLGASIWRMMAGAAYFNSSMLMDPDMLRGIDPEVVGAHLLVGAFFTRMRKPVFEEKFPSMSRMDSNLELLRKMGIDPQQAEIIGNYYDARILEHGVYSGILDQPTAKEIHGIFYDAGDAHINQSRNQPQTRVGALSDRHELVSWAYNEVALQSEAMRSINDNKLERPLDILNLTADQVEKIYERLSNIEIDAEGTKLSKKNFWDWLYTMEQGLVSGGIKVQMESMLDMAKALGIDYDRPLRGEGGEINIDTPIVMERIVGAEYSDIPELVQFNSLVKTFEDYGYIRFKEVSDPSSVETVKTTMGEGAGSKISLELGTRLRTMTETLKQSAYGTDNNGESVSLDVHPVFNEWTRAAGKYKRMQNIDMFYKATGGKGEITAEVNTLRQALQTVLGDKVPSTPAGIRELVNITRPEGMKEEEWNKITSTLEFHELVGTVRHLASMWSMGKSHSAEAKDIPYDKATTLALFMESKGISPQHIPIDTFSQYYWRRFLESANVDSKLVGILSAVTAHNVKSPLSIINMRGKRSIEIPDRDTMKKILAQDGHTGEKLNKMIEKYDAILGHLSKIEGEVINFTPVQVMDRSTIDEQANYTGFVNDAYVYTQKWETDIRGDYKGLTKSAENYQAHLDMLNSLKNKVFEVDSDGVEKLKSLSIEDGQLIVDDINQILEDKYFTTLITRDGVTVLKELSRAVTSRTKVEQTVGGVHDSEGRVRTAAQALDRFINEKTSLVTRTEQIVNRMVQGIDYKGSDRFLSTRMHDANIAQFTRELKAIGVKLEKNPTLKHLGDMYIENGMFEQMLKTLEIHIQANERMMTPEEFNAYAESYRKFYNDQSSTDLGGTDKYSPGYITNHYGKYNENLEAGGWSDFQREFRLAQSKGDAQGMITSVSGAVANLEKAIFAKNGDQPELNLRELNEVILGPLLPAISSTLGTARTEEVRITQAVVRKDGKRVVIPVLEMRHGVSGDGLVEGFVQMMGNSGVKVLRLSQEGDYGGRKTNIGQMETRHSGGVDGIISDVNHLTWSLQETKTIASQENLDPSQKRFVRVITSFNNQLIVGMESVREGDILSTFREWYDGKHDSYADGSTSQRNFENLYSEFRDISFASENEAREIIRAMYWDYSSQSVFDSLVENATNKNQLQEIVPAFFKYLSLGEAVGPKTQLKHEFYDIISNIPEIYDNLSDIQKAVTNEFKDGKRRVRAIALDDTQPLWDSRRAIVETLQKMAGQPGIHVETRRFIGEQITRIQAEGAGVDFPSLGRSTIDAQTYLGTNYAVAAYLPKGASLGMDNIAGLKQSVWSNVAGAEAWMKTNFVYDPTIARVLDALGIDILTTASAAKEWGVDPVNITIDDAAGFSSIQEIMTQDIVGNKLSNAQHLDIPLTSFYLSKIEGRDAQVNMTYALGDFLHEAAYNSLLTDYLDYSGIVNREVDKMSVLLDRSRGAPNRVGAAAALLNELVESGGMVPDSNDSMASYMFNMKVDPDSILMTDTLQRIAFKNLIKHLKSPKSEFSSYSIIVPFLEGTIPVYDSSSKSVVYGGKKLSYADRGLDARGSWDKIKFIVHIDGRDIIIGTNSRERYYQDSSNVWFHDLTESQVSGLRNRIEALRVHLEETDGKFGDMFDFLSSKNVGEDIKMYIHSNSIRMPNMGGDIAAHRVEGFFLPDMGNVVGINPLDLASRHQGDFDADALFSYHDAPMQLVTAIAQQSGMVFDSFVYEQDQYSIDIFSNGGTTKKAGISASASGVRDAFAEHVQKYENSKAVFGPIKRVSSSVSALARSGFNINVKVGANDVPISIDALDMSGPDFVNWLQRYRNTLQSIIDATKRSNFVSTADQRAIKKFILFNDVSELPGGSEHLSRAAEYKEENFNGLIDLSGQDLSSTQVKIVQDMILEIVTEAGRPQSILSGVFNEGGLASPELRDVYSIGSEFRKMAQDPTYFAFRKLLSSREYASGTAKQRELVNMMLNIGDQEFRSRQEMVKALFGKRPGQLALKASDRKVSLNINVDAKTALESTPGGKVISLISSSTDVLGGNPKTARNKKMDLWNSRVTRIIDHIEDVAYLAGSEGQEELRDIINPEGEGDIFGLSGQKITLKTSFLDGNPKAIQNYSLALHILERERSSLRGYVNRNIGNKSQAGSLGRARHRLSVTDAAVDYLEGLQTQALGSEAGFRKKYYFNDVNLTAPRSKTHNRFNGTDVVQYVYRKLPSASGRVRYKSDGYILPRKSKWLYKGNDYVILKTPLRWNHVSEKETADAFAMLKVTGEIELHHIPDVNYNENTMSDFGRSVQNLKQDIRSLAKEAYEASDGLTGRNNWGYERLQEDSMIEEFMSQQGVHPSLIQHEKHAGKLEAVVKYLLRPDPVPGNIFFKGSEGRTPLPQLKINKRLTLAVLRSLKRHGDGNDIVREVTEKILTQYGDYYRQSMFRVELPQGEDMYRSGLYSGDTYLVDRPWIIDLAFGRSWMYQPALQEFINNHPSTSRIKGMERRIKDNSGVMNRIIDYGNYSDIESFENFYKNMRDLEDKDSWFNCQ